MPLLTVKEQLQYFCYLKKIPVAEENEEICRVLRAVHMSELADVKCKKLSGGMVRRVGIAQAILGHPKLILFDEPTTGLDIEERCHFYEIFQQLNGICPVLIASHITEDIVEGCTNTIILKNGIVILQEKTKDIKPSLQEVYLSCMHALLSFKTNSDASYIAVWPYIRGCSNNRPLFISLEYDAACIRRTAKKCIFACTDWHPFSYDLVPDT